MGQMKGVMDAVCGESLLGDNHHMTEPYRLPTATILRAERLGEVSTVAIEISQEDYLTYPVAPASIWRRNPDQTVFRFHQLIGRDGPRLVFETYRTAYSLPAVHSQGEFGSWWCRWAIDAVRDMSAT